MEIVVDGIIYESQSTGGISRLFTETLPRVCCLDEAVEMTLFTTGPLSQQLPAHARISNLRIPDLTPYLRPAALWRPLEERVKQTWLTLWIGSGRGKLWHSTYFTRPPTWKGLEVVTVPDMIYERFPDLFAGAASDRFREQRKRCVLAADAVLCISDATRRDVQEFYQMDSDRLHVVHLACSDFFGPLPAANLSHKGGRQAAFFPHVGSRAPLQELPGPSQRLQQVERAVCREAAGGRTFVDLRGRPASL